MLFSKTGSTGLDSLEARSSGVASPLASSASFPNVVIRLTTLMLELISGGAGCEAGCAVPGAGLRAAMAEEEDAAARRRCARPSARNRHIAAKARAAKIVPGVSQVDSDDFAAEEGVWAGVAETAGEATGAAWAGREGPGVAAGLGTAAAGAGDAAGGTPAAGKGAG
jgi:hypothetical protein